EKYLDANARVTQEKDPLGRTTKYEYTGRGYISKITYPNSSTETRTYDTKGNMLTKKVSGEGGLVMTTTYTYDSKWNKVKTVTDALGRITTYEYDSTNGDLKKITLPAVAPATVGSIWQMSYTTQGLLETLTTPDSHLTTYTYDSLGNLATKTNALGYTTTYTRDSSGNVTDIADPLGNSTIYGYDMMNRLTNSESAKLRQTVEPSTTPTPPLAN
ncbi:MAG: RHS repeat protein, partial [Chlamydiae bacterium]|nr:RHS repeat protein [Chlamydiota bacterium]